MDSGAGGPQQRWGDRVLGAHRHPHQPAHAPVRPWFLRLGLLPEGPYQVQKAIFGAKDYRSKWYSVVLTEGSHTLQELIEDYDPDAYTPAVVNAVATLRDETRTARDEAAQILEDVTAGAVPDSAVASKITAEGSASRAAVDARVAAGTTGFLTQEVAEETYAPRVGACSSSASTVSWVTGPGVMPTRGVALMTPPR
ncbi:hypothetical protein [Gordonia westfalica]|uniref:hypothetical protein n=1 Tax=Gordonia westfalica TaxID=158898 RepID=UPI000A3F4D3C|nr:hypothetical protein [Gordonia westfalica]